MKIQTSSAEFIINANLETTLFGAPKINYEKSGNNLIIHAQDYEPTKLAPISLQQIEQLNMWDEYKQEIKQLYNPISTFLQKDVNGQDWIVIGGTGWGVYWTVDANNLSI